MLQEGGNNSYSWWVASHIRTKQSKWLEQSLQEMEENVSTIIELISGDGDSFAKRAEMYYEKRPELLHFVEESYRVYRALAEQYDHMSQELQNANSTLASAFPERFQFAMNDDDDEYRSSSRTRSRKKMVKTGIGYPNQKTNIPSSVPKQFPTNNIKSIIALTAKTNDTSQPPPKKAGWRKGSKAIEALRSGLKKAQALDEIDKLQKRVLTEDEFTGSSYNESAVAKYEKEIKEMQEKVSTLQDELTVRKTIEDDEARSLILKSAFKSKQPELSTNANQERRRIYNSKAQEMISSFNKERERSKRPSEKQTKVYEDWLMFDDDDDDDSQDKETEMLGGGKMIERFQFKGDSSISVSGMVEKIDELANKVINLESVVSSQTAIIPKLDEMHTHIQSLENDKANLIDGNNVLNDNLKETKHKLKGLQEQDHTPERTNVNFEKFAEESSSSSSNLELISQSRRLTDHIQDRTNGNFERFAQKTSSSNLELIPDLRKLSDLKIEEEIGESDSTSEETATVDGNESSLLSQQAEPNNLPWKSLQVEDSRVPLMEGDVSSVDVQQKEHDTSNKCKSPPMETGNDVSIIQHTSSTNPCPEQDEMMFPTDPKHQVMKTLGEVDDNSEDGLAELRELRNENANKDEEIQSLQQKLVLLEQKLEDQYKNVEELAKEENTSTNNYPEVLAPSPDQEDDYIFKLMHDVNEPRTVSPTEEKLRAAIDELLEENLDFWMRLSSSFSEINSRVEILRKEVATIAEEKDKKSEDERAKMYDDLKEIEINLTVWSRKSMALKDELQGRFPQLCQVQEDITKALDDGAMDDQMHFTSLHAAKFQGEVLNMKQENNRIAEKLQASLDNMGNLQTQVEGIIKELNQQELVRTGSSKSIRSKNQVPIRTFISKLKLKKKQQQQQKESLFSGAHPAFHLKYQPLRY